MSENVESGQQDEGHRVRSARRKRERMRILLLESVLSVYPGKDPRTPAVIDDVIRHAGVSRGTFYKYFNSLEQAVEELAGRLGDELASSYATLYAGVTDPELRAATGFQLYLSRALIEPSWGSFVVHLSQLDREKGLLRQIRSDLTAGVDAGAFIIADLEVALDLILGAKIGAIRQLLEGAGSRRYIMDMTAMILRALGVAPDRADQAAREVSILLRKQGPEILPWWRPFE
jgi:AcrR family transcriptional regulator